MSIFKPALVVAALAAASFSAQATLWAGTGGLSASFITLSSANVTGGALYTGNAMPDAAIPYNATPVISTVGTWLAAGPDNTNNGGGDAVLHLGAGTTGVSFLWGSPDDYNSFSVTTSAGVHSISSALFNTYFGVALGGDQNAAYYIHFVTDGGETISSVAFQSPGTNAIEIANVAVVPEPEAYGLALAGLGVVGFAMSRRRRS